MGLKYIDILATLLLNLIQYGCSENILSCNDTILISGCTEHQKCNSTTLKCDCLRGYILVGDDCEKPGEDDGYSGATIATIMIFTFALLIGGSILVIRKYRLIDYIRHKIQSRRNNDVLYEDVMIGNDDPPLSP